MTTDTVNYIVQHKIKDDKFDIDNLHHYNLSLQVSLFDFQVCVTDSKSNACLEVESYRFNGAPSVSATLAHLHKIYEEHHFLKAGFWKDVKMSFKNQYFSLIPASLFKKDALADYLQINAGTDLLQQEIFYYKHTANPMINIFSVEKELLHFFRETYSGTTLHILHQGSAFIEGVLKYAENMQARNMFLLYEEKHILLIITDHQQLVYFNIFSINHTSDVVKYVMMVLKKLALDQYTTKLIAWGNLDTQAPVFQELYRYVQNISLGQKPYHLKFGYKFDEIPEHRHFSLYGINLCE